MVASVLCAAAVLMGMGCAAHQSDGTAVTKPTGPVERDAEGRAYRVRTIPKSQAVRVDAGHVRTTWGITLDLVGEDEASYRYKLYEVSETRPAASPTPSAADRKKVTASYRTDVGSSDRLRWTPFGNGLPAQGQWRDGFDLADVDGDGKLDIVHGPPRTGQPVPRVFLGDGRGGWRLWREAKYPGIRIDYGAARAGDLDGDGDGDLVLASHLRGFTALRNDGGGTFTDISRGLPFAPPGTGAPTPFSSRAFRLVDWNGDRRLDVLALGEGPRLELGRGEQRAVAGAAMGVALFLNEGTDGWRRAEYGGPKNDLFGQALALGDFDADGRGDFATASNTLGRVDLVGFGTADGRWRQAALAGVRPSAYVRAVAAADFDGDGRDDLAIGYTSYELQTWRSGIDVLLTRADGSTERRVLAAREDKTGIFALAAGDLDGDRARDLVGLSGDGEVIVFLGDGRGGFRREQKPPPAWPGTCRGVHVALRDLDADGRDDVVAAFAEESSDVTGEPRCPKGGGLTAWKSTPR